MWLYKQPVKIYFGAGELSKLGEIISENGYTKGVLVADPFLCENGASDALKASCGDKIIAVFSDLSQNPTVVDVMACAKTIVAAGADFVVAMGGGSAIDCSKAAASVAATGENITKYHGTGIPLPKERLPLIAVPTTAGTGAEVTCAAVLTDNERGVKAPIISDNFYPVAAIIDPELTYTVPKKVAVGTGLDVLAHAIEGYISINHQPICDAIAVAAARTALKNIVKACSEPFSSEARDGMAQASVMAGLAFSLPKTGASHACSFVLTNKFSIPHGEACGLTLEHFLRLCSGERRCEELAELLGYKSCVELADVLCEIKLKIGARVDLKDKNLTEQDVEMLVKASRHPNMNNCPVEITDTHLQNMYNSFR